MMSRQKILCPEKNSRQSTKTITSKGEMRTPNAEREKKSFFCLGKRHDDSDD